MSTLFPLQRLCPLPIPKSRPSKFKFDRALAFCSFSAASCNDLPAQSLCHACPSVLTERCAWPSTDSSCICNHFLESQGSRCIVSNTRSLCGFRENHTPHPGCTSDDHRKRNPARSLASLNHCVYCQPSENTAL